MENAKQDTGRLNELIVHCKDDSSTYRAAACGRHRDELLALSRRRSSFANVLSGFVTGAGSSPSRYGSVLGWTRLAFFELRVKVLGERHVGDSLAACAEQESRTEEAYKSAVALSWPTELGGILRSQLAEIENDHVRMRHLRGTA